jgi:hypothetical protein
VEIRARAPPWVLDLRGYATPTLIEATTKPHDPSIECDLWTKWNQARIDANEAAMEAEGMHVQRPINDWCSNSELPPARCRLLGAGSFPAPRCATPIPDPFVQPIRSNDGL